MAHSTSIVGFESKPAISPAEDEKKPEVMQEEYIDASKHQAEVTDPNSPEAILARYNLLKDMSEDDLAKLNHRVRRRM
jgi:hypothetical protein